MDHRGDGADKPKDATGKGAGDPRLDPEGKPEHSGSKIQEKLREVTDLIRGAAQRSRRP